MEDAINQLIDLGVTKGQARKALARYNNDVARAADYIFSGADLSDDDDTEKVSRTNLETDEQLAIRLSIEEENQKLFDDNTQTVPSSVTTRDYNPPVVQHSSSNWSVVPYNKNEFNSTTITATTTTTTTAASNNEFSLTWWKDFEDPNERMALDDVPIGLRPPSYNFAYSPIVIQALFHVTAFRQTVLAFRPIPYAWGDPKNYWKGFGDPIPGYTMREVIIKRPVAKPSPSVSFDGQDMAQLSLIDDYSSSSDINEEIVTSDLSSLIVESTDPVIEEEEEQIENELQLMPKCLKTLAEMQKCFAFLSNSRRLYGNVSHYVRALNTKLTANGWESSDKTFEGKKK
ncbi:MAG: hypothetical protein EXX96DRAFT_477150 [Benjaminiella poitrasii]|nr:MAG: hypothetical protein EXX96DRAFT_477150 [Benjaminiella poitrasii]